MVQQLDPSFRASLSRYLDQDIIDGLPERRAFNKASRHLNTLRVALASYLPKYIADKEESLTKEYGDLRRGTFMFADVSGFTALSEKLEAATGVEGAEIMTEIINDFFSTMLEILAKSDGQMLKFAGDALLTFFPTSSENTSDDPDTTVAAKAIRTGLRMQRAMQENFQPIQHPLLVELFGDHDLELTMSIGISRGRLFEALVGNATQRDHMIMGALPGRAAEAEEAGIRDDVIIDGELAEVFKDRFSLQPAPVGEGFFTVIDNLGNKLSDFELTTIITRRRSSGLSGLVAFADDDSDPLEELRGALERVDTYARFVAHEVVNKLAVVGDRVEAQNRPATVIFAYFHGIAQMLDEWGRDELPRVTSILNRFYSAIQQVIATYGGSLTRSDPYKDGSKLLITFGAPIAHTDDPFRAVATGIEMLRQVQAFNKQLHKELPPVLQRETYLQMRMGITHGQAFAGEVGWKQRREYTVMGDDVNLAARLMGKGQMGNILVSDRIFNRVERFFETEKLAPMQMKGKSKLTQAYDVQGWKGNIADIPRTSNTRFVGRDTLRLTLELGLEQVRARRRRIVALVGFTGIGKTRIAKQLLPEAERRGFKVGWATCHTLDHARASWASIIGQLLSIDQDATLDNQHRALREALAAWELEDLESLLDRLLFGNSAADSDDHAHDEQPNLPTEGDSLPEGTAEAITHILKQLIKDGSVMIVLDDLHKGHPATVEVLQRVAEEIARGRLLIMLAYEPGTDLSLNPKQTIIEDLDQDESFRIATDILHVPELGSQLRRVLWEQTHGRPLFVEVMLQEWQEKDLLVIEHGEAELKPDANPKLIPDHIRNLIISTVDRLPSANQKVLRAAAVLSAIRPGFTPEMLQKVADVDAARMENFINQSIDTQIFAQGDDSNLHIHYGLVQQTLYESLTRMQRHKLHGNAAKYFQKQADTDQHFFVIVDHLVKSGKVTRALEMIERAAEDAEADGDFEKSLSFYDHALALFPHDASLARERARLVKLVATAVTKLPHLTTQEAEATVSQSAPRRAASKADSLSMTALLQTVLGDYEEAKQAAPACRTEGCADYGKPMPDANLIRYGKAKDGRQRYKCKTCRRTFTEPKLKTS